MQRSSDGRVLVSVASGPLQGYLCQTVQDRDGVRYVNGLPQEKGVNDIEPVGEIFQLNGYEGQSGPIGPIRYLSALQESEVIVWGRRN